ncbi:DUF2255 family protein [Cellulomonas soli]|uniref:DUF2255 family protein n=1 Tax=Cellulomonas soli TaxID=931535 RepID=UPI003F850083
MTSWTADELDRVGGATELRVASRRPDGSLRPFVTIWVAATGHQVYVRSARGTDNPWFRRATESGRGRIIAGGVERDVRFEAPDPQVHPQIDEALHLKYDRYGPGPVGAITGSGTWAGTLRVIPE